MKMKSKAEEIIIVKKQSYYRHFFPNPVFKRKRLVYSFNVSSEWCTETKSFKTQKIKEAEITLQNIKQFSHFKSLMR
jgi:4-amino-4-deoxychorismate lyase